MDFQVSSCSPTGDLILREVDGPWREAEDEKAACTTDTEEDQEEKEEKEVEGIGGGGEDTMITALESDSVHHDVSSNYFDHQSMTALAFSGKRKRDGRTLEA